MTVKSWPNMWREHETTMELTLGRPTPISSQDTSPLPDAQQEDNASKIEAYLQSLEDERRKIEAFKRELPICMHLLSSEIEALRKQLCATKHDDTYKKDRSAAGDFSTARPPALCKADLIISNILNSYRDEPNSCESLGEDEVHPHTPLPTSCWQRGEGNTIEDQEEVSAMASKLYKTRTTGSSCEDESQACNNLFRTRPGGAFVPFFKEKKMKLIDEAAEKASSPPATDHQDDLHYATKLNGVFIGAEREASYQQLNEPFPPAPSHGNNGLSNQPSPHRKPRRCWSAELHRKFVNALKQLGGPEVATPKQIREVMQVDGLTNDEVKSHLQKYRLHTKRPSPTGNMHIPAPVTQTTTGAAAPQLVVLGGIWVPQDYPLKQSLYMNNVAQMMDPSLLKQAGQQFGSHSLNVQT